MRILALGLAWFPESPGGLSRYYGDLLGQLALGGHPVRGLVAGSARVEAESLGRVSAFSSVQVPLPRRLLACRAAIGKALAADRPDLVASHFALYTLPALDRLGDRPLVVHFHGPWACEAGVEGGSRVEVAIKRRLEGLVYRRAQRCIVLSPAFGKMLVERYGVDAQRIRVIPGGVDAIRFGVDIPRAAARESLGWPAGRPILLTVRRLVQRMGLDRLVAAMRTVCRRHPDALLLIAGQGSLAAHLQSRIRDLGLTGHVRLIGFVPDGQLPVAYRAADLSVVPSVALEGFGLSAAESLAAGTPVLVTPVGGLPDVVSDLAPGLILRDASVAAIAAGIDDALAGRLPLPSAARCAAYARARFDWPQVMPRILETYRDSVS
ncbi:MAG: glycosyltransferase family 4 protein [Lautropia sp.]